jgi:hypothetical protein
LGAFRNYFGVRYVGPLADHFVVAFGCGERMMLTLSVDMQGRMYFDSGLVGGGLALVPSGAPHLPVPNRAARAADRIRAALELKYPQASDLKVVYEGTYREVEVSELLVLAPTGATQRNVHYVNATLRADAELTAIDAEPASVWSGVTRLCVHPERCSPALAWMDFVPDKPTGVVVMRKLLDADAGTHGARFQQSALKAARLVDRGKRGVTIDQLVQLHGSSLLPAGLAPPVAVGIAVSARVPLGATARQVHAPVVVVLPLDAVLFAPDGASGTASAIVAGLPLRLSLTLRAASPPDSTVTTPQEVRLNLKYTVEDGRTTRSRELELLGRVLIDGGSAVAVSLGRNPPLGDLRPDFVLDGRGPYSHFDVRLFIRPRSGQ